MSARKDEQPPRPGLFTKESIMRKISRLAPDLATALYKEPVTADSKDDYYLFACELYTSGKYKQAFQNFSYAIHHGQVPTKVSNEDVSILSFIQMLEECHTRGVAPIPAKISLPALLKKLKRRGLSELVGLVEQHAEDMPAVETATDWLASANDYLLEANFAEARACILNACVLGTIPTADLNDVIHKLTECSAALSEKTADTDTDSCEPAAAAASSAETPVTSGASRGRVPAGMAFKAGTLVTERSKAFRS